MKSAGVVALLTATLLPVASGAPAPAGRRDDAAGHLGIVFTPPPSPQSGPANAAAPAPDFSPVIVLPKFDVREARLELETHRLLTAKGWLAEAKRRELSPMYQKTFGPLAAAAAVYFNPLSLLMGVRPNDAEATVLYEQDEHLRRRHEADSLIELLRDEDPAAYRELRAATRATFQLRSPNTGEH